MNLLNIAFAGLGNMGLPMARNLKTAGHNIKGYDPALTDDDLNDESGITLCSSLEQTVKNSDLVITMLPNGSIVLDVLKRILAGGTKPSIIIDCSTIDIDDARAAHSLVSDAGIGFLDAPVSGGIAGAAAGTLTSMVGGSEELLNSVREALEPVFTSMVYCGPGGSGQAAKICNNMLLATAMIGTCETFNLGRKLGLDANTLFSVLSSSTGSCWSVNNYCPVPGVGPTSPADNQYHPGFSAKMMLKDMNLTQQAAQSVSQATPLGAQALALYQLYVDNGGAENDFSGIIQFLDTLERT